jgi:hypothetical protein
MVSDTDGEPLVPAWSIVLGIGFVTGAVVLGRYALRQRAVFRADQGKAIGSVDDLFEAGYHGEPKIGWADDGIRQPGAWFMVLVGAIGLGVLGLVMIAGGVAQMV